MWKIFYNYGHQATPISRPSTPEPVGRGHQGHRREASPIRLRRRERRAAVKEAIDIGDNTEEAVNVNETIPEQVEETEPAENAEDTDQSVNAIRAAEISIYTLAVEADEATNLEATNIQGSVSDKEKSAAEKVAVVAKGEAAKASKTGTNMEKF